MIKIAHKIYTDKTPFSALHITLLGLSDLRRDTLRKTPVCAILMGMPKQILHRFLYPPVGIVAMLMPALAWAQAGGAFPVDETYEMISGFTLVAAQFLNILTWFVFSFLIILLDPRFIFDMTGGEEAGLMTALNTIWQLSRNIMNVAFAVGLVGAAIYTVVTANKEFVSNNLKTFVLAVILVNFSWFIPRVVLDIANVAAAMIYSLPNAVADDSMTCRYMSSNTDGCIDPGAPLASGMVSCACKAVADFEPFPEESVRTSLEASDPAWKCTWLYCIRFVKLDTTTATQHGSILNGLVVNHARLSQLAIITRVVPGRNISDLLLFILRELVVVVIHIALFFPLVALLLALVIRIPILWLTMAFMPLYFLSWVIPDEISFLAPFKEKAKLIWDWFMKAAFLPAAVAIPLSIGFVMANVGARIQFTQLEAIPFNLIDGMGTFAQLLWVIMVLGILWSGTFMMLEMMTAEMPGGSMIQSIKSTGEESAKFAAELPLATVPIPGVGNLLNKMDALKPSNLRHALKHPDGGLAGLQEALSDRGSQKREAGGAANVLAGDKDKTDKLVEALKDFRSDQKNQYVEALRSALKAAGVSSSAISTPQGLSQMVHDMHDSLKEKGKPLMSDDELKKFDSAIDKLKAASAPPPAPGGPAPAAHP